MDRVMTALKERDLMFIDSKTISSSVAAQSAAAHGLDYAERDIFLDHENSRMYVEKALRDLEIIAKKRGYAIAIGHPREATVQVLKEWLPTMKDRGLTLIPVSALAYKSEEKVEKIAQIVPDIKNIEPAAGLEKYSVERIIQDMPKVSYSSEPFGPVRGLVPRPSLWPEPY
jgi:polysaccharide deacetylase 2 family uncharacterized protein YibQ